MAKDSIEESKNELVAVPVVTGGTAGTVPELLPVPLTEIAEGEIVPGERRHIVKSATLVMLLSLIHI